MGEEKPDEELMGNVSLLRGCLRHFVMSYYHDARDGDFYTQTPKKLHEKNSPPVIRQYFSIRQRMWYDRRELMPQAFHCTPDEAGEET